MSAIELLILVLMMLVFIPVMVYITFKLGMLGILRGREVFQEQLEKKKSQVVINE